ncbi:MAG: dihydrofolate reductase family protein, partial [Thermoplasmata archaeon]
MDMARLRPFDNLYDRSSGRLVPMPEELARVYGSLRLRPPGPGPYVVGNLATTLDGVVSLDPHGRSLGVDITGSDPGDRLLMGVLRAAADAVVLGAGTLRAVPGHRWTAQRVDPDRAPAYSEMRRRLGKPEFPRTVIVSASGRLDAALPVFTPGGPPVLVVTTSAGARRLALPPTVSIATCGPTAPISARSVLAALRRTGPHGLVLVEGGPHLLTGFLAEEGLRELFLTLAPQVAGRSDPPDRPGLVAGRAFAPKHPLWAR